jgi:organic hydroperoxide reductase OsmC/OhrA
MSEGRSHTYAARLRWTGNRGQGTRSYQGYGRDHELQVPGKPTLLGSSDPAFRGDRDRYNPEELLVASLSSCHMLWFLHLCAEAGLVVSAYEDQATGTLVEGADGGGRFTEVVLHPQVTLAEGDPDRAEALHHRAHQLCFIANSVNFPVRCQATARRGS